jgi:hypothetical protein
MSLAEIIFLKELVSRSIDLGGYGAEDEAITGLDKEAYAALWNETARAVAEAPKPETPEPEEEEED